MKVLKFGGTSVGTTENLQKIKKILISDLDQKIVVCSAISGVTDQLVALAKNVRFKNTSEVIKGIDILKEKHLNFVNDLIKFEDKRKTLKNNIHQMFDEFIELTQKEYSETLRSSIITFGETLLTHIFNEYLVVEGVSSTLIRAKDFMLVDVIDTPNIDKVSKRLARLINTCPKAQMYITQGFVCKDKNGNISDLRRGGSDYSATIIGAAINAEEIQIWTDIDGVHTNDPRFVEETRPIQHLSYTEASELAHFGAKVLHPQTVLPVISKNIPIVLKNIYDPSALGTMISAVTHREGLKGISAKDKITIIKIKSNKVLLGYDFLSIVFEIFGTYQTSIDMVTTSNESVSLAVDCTQHLEEIVRELEKFATITIESGYSIICMVGASIIKDHKSHRLFEILTNIPVHMISFGGSDSNIMVLIDTENKVEALQLLNDKLFLSQEEAMVF